MEINLIHKKINKFIFKKKNNNKYKKFIFNINISFYTTLFNIFLFFKFILSIFYIIIFIFTFNIENLDPNKFIYK